MRIYSVLYLVILCFVIAIPAQSATDSISAASFDLQALQSLPYSEKNPRLSIPQLLTQPTTPNDFWIAVEITENNAILHESVLPLVLALQTTFPEQKVAISLIASEHFAQEVRRKKIPFVIASAGTSVRLTSLVSAVPLAARENTYNQQAGLGALLITRHDRSDIQTLQDLKDKNIALPSTLTFGPWQWLQGRFQQEGISIDSFFHSLRWCAQETPDIFDAVLQKRVDVGLINTCVYENLVQDGFLDPQALKVVSPLPEEDAGVCQSSTQIGL